MFIATAMFIATCYEHRTIKSGENATVSLPSHPFGAREELQTSEDSRAHISARICTCQWIVA